MNYRNSRTIMWILLGVGGLLAFISTRREMPPPRVCSSGL